MPHMEILSNLHESLVQTLLDIYTEQTKLPVAYYQFNKNRVIWSKNGDNYYSPLCLGINGKFPITPNTPCDNDHMARCKSARGKIELCYMGLWNIALPVKLENEVVGTLISGQRRLKDDKSEQASLMMFKKYLEELKPANYKILEKQYNETPIIDQKDYDRHLLINLRKIQEYLYSIVLTQDEKNKKRRNKIQQLAHEFLLPIQSIVANAANLFHEVKEDELKEMAKDILQEMQKLALISENMRSSLIETKEQPYHFLKYNIYKCLMPGVELFQKEAEKKCSGIIKPYTTDGENFPEIEMSLDDLTRAFKNLIHNAVKYSYSGLDRFISIIGDPSGEYYCISIRNYGIGILAEEISSGKIFEDGYRGELSTDRHRTGSGLGLAEVKKIIEKHNGKIHITSELKGTAYKTVVKVYLPYRQNITKKEK